MNSRKESLLNELKSLLVRVASTSGVSFTTFNFRCNMFLLELKKDEEANKEAIEEISKLKKIAEELEESLSMPRGKRSYAKAGNIVGKLKHRGIKISKELEEEILNAASQYQPE